MSGDLRPDGRPFAFSLADLGELGAFLRSATKVIPLVHVANGDHDLTAIALRHDVDHFPRHSLDFARWEAERGYQASYYILPTADYWTERAIVKECALAIQDLGHEVGLHADAYHVCGGDVGRALVLLRAWADEMRRWGIRVDGCADHGSGEPLNVDLWGRHGRRPSEAGLLYEAYILHRSIGAHYLSDSGGNWNEPLERVYGKPTVVLVHPEHWRLP